MNRSTWLLAMVGFLLLAGGCAKQVPSPDLTFESHQSVVLTFKNGDEVEGKIAPGNRVELRESQATYTAIVRDLTEEAITLTKVVRVDNAGSVELQVARAADAKFAVVETEVDQTLLRSDIVEVSEVRFDYGRAARSTTFWTCGAVVLTLLLGERS
jgi:hypothetical protein